MTYPNVESIYSYEADSVDVRLLQVKFKVFEPPNQIFRLGDFDADGIVVESELSAGVSLECFFSFTTYDSIDHEDVAVGSNTITIQTDLAVNALISISFINGLTSPDSDFEVVDVDLVEVTDLDEIDWGFVEPDLSDPDDYDDLNWNETEDADNSDENTSEDEHSNQRRGFDIDDSPF
ncbi:MAG: hypothetical protein LH702_17900 [Phormidesmis sp. CAN_BIN44]|nr:hypothetical protein [Phormidesmis sp. CAN_BIN44]